MKSNSINKLFDLSGKTAILTGSAGRLGSQFAHTLAESGANLVLIDIDEKHNLRLANSLKKNYHSKISTFSIDISDKNSLQNTAKQILKKYKKIDILINNAFFNPSINQKSITKNFDTFPLDVWNKVISVNLTGVFLCCQVFGKIMVKQKNGSIVNISSIYGMIGPDQRIYGDSKLNSQISYAATKGSIVNMTRYLASYWHRKNVRVNTLTLGGVMDKSYMKKSFIDKYSEKTMLGRMASKDDFNGALLFLTSNASSYMTGSNLIIDGGWTAW